MNRDAPLQGGCSCGRNKYTVVIPQDTNEVAQVFFDNSHNHRRSQGTTLSAFLRIPLSWYQSTTYAFLSDETPSSIRRSYTSPNEQNAKRHFCGFCGTPLSYWTETPKEEKDFIAVTLGSLEGECLRDLEEWGVLPREALEDAEGERKLIEKVAPFARSDMSSEDGSEGLPWFETMVEGSRLGNMKRSMGTRRSKNGNVRVEWEIMEWTEEGDREALPSGKRKLGEVVDSEDSTMEGTH